MHNGEEKFRQIAPHELRERFDAMMAHEEGTRVGTDPEALHDMRVASRRLRAALEAFAICYDGKGFDRVVRQTKELTGALGAVRDSDVLLERLRAYAETVPADEVPAIADLIARTANEREERRAILLRDLDDLARSAYADRFRHEIARPQK